MFNPRPHSLVLVIMGSGKRPCGPPPIIDSSYETEKRTLNSQLDIASLRPGTLTFSGHRDAALDPDTFGAPPCRFAFSVERRARIGEINNLCGERQNRQTQVERRGETLRVVQTGWPLSKSIKRVPGIP